MNENNNLPGESKNTTVQNNNQDGTYQVVLPCNVKEFGGFVAGLLGKPQETKGEIEGTFKLTPKEIANICHLVTQRVSRQNESSLINLGVTVHYDDGDSVTHHNLADFESYHPTTACKPVGISIDFVYLIKFQGREVPEKQEIHVSIETDIEHGHHRVKRWFRSGIFMFRILHTERTWASDISGLLKGHATTIIKKPSKIVNFIIENDSELITYLSVLIFLSVLFFWSTHTLSLLDNIPADFSLERYWVKTVTIFAFLLGVLVTVTHFFQFNITLRATSSILLTQSDLDNASISERKYTRKWHIYFLGWFFEALAGFLAKYAYENWI